MMASYDRPTPVLSDHARDRCREMGISTKVAKRIVQHPSMTRPGSTSNAGCVMAVSDDYPGYVVVYAPELPPVIVTVLFRTTEEYTRNGTTYEATDE